MINYSESAISEVWAHHIGRHIDNDGIKYSHHPLEVEQNNVEELFLKYFFEKFIEPSFYSFTFSTGEIDLNPIFAIAKKVFADNESLKESSIDISKYLYDNSKHPNIKAGDLIIAMINDVLIEDELLDVLCIFKSENKDAFITLDYQQDGYSLNKVAGINTDKLDKACLIFNTETEKGFKVCALDRSNKEKEAQFWINDFLNVQPRDDDYHHTKNMIQATKHFIKDRIKPLYDIDKADEAYMLQRSKEYLENEEQFDRGTYAEKVFKEKSVIEEFEFFKEDYKNERNIKLEDNFSVNYAAVKNQSKVFKSVLKLDKNFHVYIHGNRSMIEKGVDESGRKYYKLFYEEEK